MAIKTVLFDLDGTLLPMDQDTFVKAYMKGLCKKAIPYGYDPEKLVDSIWKGTGAMIQNDGTKNNETVFWNVFAGIFGEESRNDQAIFDDFYHHEFQLVKESCGFQPQSAELIGLLKQKGLRIILATNPIFPRIATESRIRWAGLRPDHFEFITTYENSRYCKPGLNYYRDILKEIGTDPTECLMVGNDVTEDMIAAKLGMQVYLLTDCLINKYNEDISVYQNGDMAALMEYLKRL